jgi:hypothetical protein
MHSEIKSRLKLEITENLWSSPLRRTYVAREITEIHTEFRWGNLGVEDNIKMGVTGIEGRGMDSSGLR